MDEMRRCCLKMQLIILSYDTKQRIVEIAYNINTRMKSNDGRISDIYRY